MVTRLTIDGAHISGRYRVTCMCGQSWSGGAELQAGECPSPALPIAECCAHQRMTHAGEPPQVVFTRRFETWLLAYWDWRNGHDTSLLAAVRSPLAGSSRAAP